MAQIQLTVKSNFDDASKALGTFGNLTKKEMEKIEKALGKLKSANMDEFVQKTQRMAAGAQATRGPLAALTVEHRRQQQQIEALIGNGMDPLDDRMEDLRDEYLKTTRAIEANNKSQKMNEQLLKGSAVAALALGAAVGTAVVVGTKSWAAYTSEIANLNTLIDITDDEFAALDSQVTQLSNSLAIQKTELGKGLYQAVSAGAENLAQALDVVGVSAKFSRAALTENAEAVDILTTAINAYGSETMSAQRASDAFFTIIKEGKITGAELSAVIGQSIPLFAAAGISLEELGAGVATLTKVGVKAPEAMTQLNGIVNAFIKPSEAMSKQLKKIGFDSGAAFLKARGLAGALEFVSTAGDGTVDMMAEMVPNIRGIRGMLAAAANNGEDFNKVLNEFNDTSGATEAALEAQTSGFAKVQFTAAQSKIILENLSQTLGQKVLPIIGAVAFKINEFVTDTEKMRKTLDIALPIVSAFAVGLVGFLVISKIIVLMKSLMVTMQALKLLMVANPALVWALGLAALVAVIVVVMRHWDELVVLADTTSQKMATNFLKFVNGSELAFAVFASNVKLSFMSMGTALQRFVVSGLEGLVSLLGKLPGKAGEYFKMLEKGFAIEQADITASQKALEAEKDEAIKLAQERAKFSNDILNINLQNIETEQNARLLAIAKSKEAAADLKADLTGGAGAVAGEGEEVGGFGSAGGKEADALAERLKVLNDIELMAQQQNIATFDEFLQARMDLLGLRGSERIEFLQEELARIQELETLSQAERVAAEEATSAKIKEIQRDQLQAGLSNAQTMLGNVGSIFSSLQGIYENAGKKSRGLAIAQKALAIAQIAINTALGISQALAAPVPTIVKMINVATISGAGIAAGIKAATTPIPSAETGGRFVVPEGGGVDNVGLRVNGGEQIDVSPRGESPGGVQTVIVKLNDETVWESVNRGTDSNEITFTSENIRDAS